MMSESLKDMARLIQTETALLHGIKKAFFVGGTNIDPAVRKCYSDAEVIPDGVEFTLRRKVDDEDEERFNAVVNGASLSGEQLYWPSPVTLTTLLPDGKESVLITEGTMLHDVPDVSYPLSRDTLDPDEYLSVSLYAESSALGGGIEVARAWFHNRKEQVVSFNFVVETSRQSGCIAYLVEGENNRRHEMWHLRLME
jgi:hypothetical protein